MFSKDGTICVDCKFKEMDGETQIGCQLGILEKYKENGVKIIEGYNDEGEDYKEFYVIEGKYCPWYRGEKWVGKNEEDARKEIASRMLDLVIYIDEEIDLEQVIDRVKAQTLSPANFHLILRNHSGPSYIYYKKLIEAKLPCPYLFHYITNPELPHGECLNMVGDKCSSYYYAVFYNNFSISNDFVEKVFVRSYRQMKPFIMAKPVDGSSGLIINTKAHKVMYGNDKKKSIQEKLLEQATEQNCLDTIISYEDLYAE